MSAIRSVELAAAVRSLRPLLQVLPSPVYAVPAADGGPAPDEAELAAWQRAIDEQARRQGVPAPSAVPLLPAEAGPFDEVVGRRLRDGGPDPGPLPAAAWVVGSGGTRFRAYEAGPPAGPAVLVVPACGMPVELIRFWLEELAGSGYRVLTWETGGMFGTDEERAGLSGDYLDGTPLERVRAQAQDLVSVLEHFGVTGAGLVALCGGAVTALAAAAARPDLVASLSVWHADFLVRRPDCRTQHQVNLAGVLELGEQDPPAAASVRDILLRAMADSVPRDLAHLVLYPYANAELLFRYCRINGAIMSVFADDLASDVKQPVLVVTSQDDETAHPGACAAVAELLPRGELAVRPHGDHISLFRGSPELLALALEFLRRPDENRHARIEPSHEQNRAIT